MRNAAILKGSIRYLLFSSCLCLLVFAGCSKPGEGEDSSANIYCSGFDNGHLVYWKNNTKHELTTVQGYDGRTKGIAVVGNDVYVVGDSNLMAKCWKNGVNINLVNDRIGSEAHAITTSGTDVYISGRDDSPTGYKAAYWKNGTEVLLQRGSGAEAIAVSGSNVYVAGYNGDSAVVWVNGVRSVLSNGYARPYGIAVSGTDVYVTGTENAKAVYWKNGVRTILPSVASGVAAIGNAIAVSGSDVYVAGYDNNAVVWKNGTKTDLSPSPSYAYSIGLLGADVFICGSVSNRPVYWKNGTQKTIPSSSAPSFALAEASSIVVLPR